MKFRTLSSRLTAVVCSVVLVPGTAQLTRSEPVSQQASAPGEAAPKIPNDQLDSLVAPIALYPDPLLAQVLAASTYPLEIVQLQQWLIKNKNLKDKALADAAAKQPWDSSIQAMAALPDLVKRLADDVQWTTDLGNAFLAQQSDVMDAVQRMRSKAKDTGNLKSNEQMKVETKVIESKSVVVIEQSSPEVVYVPSYNPTVVYGPPVYPYPPVSYPPPGYYAAGMAISFGVGVAMGAAWGGGWGNCGWGGNNDVTINNNNNYNRNSNVSGGNRNTSVGSGNRGGGAGGNWQHNPQHRGVLRTQTGRRRTNSAARLEEIPWAIARPMRASGSSSRAQATARPAVQATGDQTAQEVQIAVVTARAAWIQTGAEVVIASEIEVYRRVRVAAQRAPLAVLRAVGAVPAPAARGAHRVWAVPVAVVAGDGGNRSVRQEKHMNSEIKVLRWNKLSISLLVAFVRRGGGLRTSIVHASAGNPEKVRHSATSRRRLDSGGRRLRFILLNGDRPGIQGYFVV